MKDGTRKKAFQHKGVSVTAFLSPSLAVLLVLHILIVGLIIEVNSLSSTLSGIMARSSGYVTNATSLLAGSSLLSDTSTNYVLRPLLPDHSPNLGPLIAYGNELSIDRRSEDVLARFQDTDAPKEAIDSLKEAADNADYLLAQQLHAFALVSSVHPLPDIPQAQLIATYLPALSEEEQAKDDEEKKLLAEDLLLSKDYSTSKGLVSSKVNAAVSIIQASQGEKAAYTGSRLNSLRAWLWGTTFGIIALLIFVFFMLYKELFLPVLRSSKLIANDEKLQEGKGFREMRLLSSSYNGLKARRDALDEALRLAAERDALTGLSNRYAYEHMAMELSHTEASKDTSLAICIFDVNFLKETNDSKGHAAGDGLLKEASYCIESCFKGGKCFRIGGDEFACVLLGVKKEEVEEMAKDFLFMQKEKGISISYGYAHQESIVSTNIEALMRKADDAMYACKEKMHHLAS